MPIPRLSVRGSRLLWLAACVMLAAGLVSAWRGAVPATVSAAVTSPEAVYQPAYSKDGSLVPPLEYREWVYLTTGLGMSYTATPSETPMFDNVFVNPEAYRSFKQTGTWPDKTVMVLEQRGAGSRASINKSGHFQSGGIKGMEVHIKDEARFPGKWAFFDVESETKTTLITQTASCYTCHTAHAAVDTTFVQFYPTLLPIASAKSTLSANYVKEAAEDDSKKDATDKK